MCGFLSILSWFQPILLRLNYPRAGIWIAISCVVPAAAIGVGLMSAKNSTIVPSVAVGLTGFALIGWRTYPWMTLVAAVPHALVLLITLDSPARGLPAITVASVPYAAILLYGTRLQRPGDSTEPIQRIDWRTVRRRISKALVVLSLFGFAWLCLVASWIWWFGTQERAERSDCAIVLGAAVHGSEPSPVFQERIRHAIELYRIGMVSKIIFTGGMGEGAIHTESEVAARFAVHEGVPEGDILTETRSRTTQQNLAEARLLMHRHVLTSAVIVSDPLHLRRADLMAKHLGIWATTSPTRTTRYRSARAQIQFLAREVYYLHYYLITGD
jgi:uncharacterized SAM-binding protein YcdF (DUF218 family)